MSEVTIPRIDPSGTFAPVARLKLLNPDPVTFVSGVAFVVPFVVDYIKGDIGHMLGNSFVLGPGLYLAQAQALVTPVQATSILSHLIIQDGIASFAQQKVATSINVIELACCGLLKPTDPPIGPDQFGECAMTLQCTGADGEVLDASILIQKLGSVGG